MIKLEQPKILNLYDRDSLSRVAFDSCLLSEIKHNWIAYDRTPTNEDILLVSSTLPRNFLEVVRFTAILSYNKQLKIENKLYFWNTAKGLIIQTIKPKKVQVQPAKRYWWD